MKRTVSASVLWASLALLFTVPAVLAVPTQALAQGHPLPRRGDYLPAEVLHAGPRVDFAALHLRKPPAGYGWFQLGHNYVMASVATGQIVEVVVL